MASVQYTGSFGGASGSGGLPSDSTSYTGTPLPANAIIKSVQYTLAMTSDSYSSSYDWELGQFAVGGESGSPSTWGHSDTMYAKKYTFSGSLDFSASDVSKFTGTSITVYAEARNSHPDWRSYMWDWSVTVNYDIPSACGAPTSVSVSPSAADPGATVTLSWSGASAGTSNPIAGYKVYRSPGGSEDYTLLQSVGAGVSSVTVTAHSTMGESYRYKVAVRGSLGDEAMSSTYATLTTRTATACGAPTTITVGSNNVSPGAKVSLRWSGAKAGTINPIKGYEVYYATSANGYYDLLAKVSSTATSSSTTVTAPSTNGETYYYKVLTVGTVEGYDSATSTAYASLTCSYSAPKAPSTVTVAATVVDAGGSTTLSWSGATSGTNNAISGYKVYRSSYETSGYDLLASFGASTTSTTVKAPNSMGDSYYYKVAVVGSLEDSEILSSTYATLTARLYTACTAPTAVATDSSNVAPGAKATISWSGAKAGTNNAITGYEIYRSTSPTDGYSRLTTVGSASTSGSATVIAPTSNGTTYYYKILTVGTVDGFDSEQSTAYATLACSFASVGAPTSVKINVSNAAPGAQATLSWSGATAGENNTITGYMVYVATSSSEEYVALTAVTTNATTGSLTVTAPTINGASNYYKVQTLGTLDGFNSELSSGYATLTCTHSTPVAPSTVKVNGAVQSYVKPNTAVTLTWSGATGGANNPIKGYDLYRNGTLWVSGLSASTTSYEVRSHTSAGNRYQFSVVTKGAYSDSTQSESVALYSYTDPTAPTQLSVSEAIAVAGSRVKLSWSGAAPGGYNDIKGYRVYRSTANGGALTLAATVDGSETAMSCYVSAPSAVGAYYYYRVETVGAYSPSSVSTAYAAVGAREATPTEDKPVDVIVTPARREKRGFVFGNYNTAVHGWTLTGWSFPEPEEQTNYVTVPGRSKGPLDLSTALTGGDPRYNSREFTATFECSDGTRLERDAVIEEMVNLLHGRRENIVFPDDPSRYAVGRLRVNTEYSDPAHAAITVTATCDPWRYSKEEVNLNLLAVDAESVAVLYNRGRKVVVPDVVVSGYGSKVYLTCGDRTWTLGVGSYRLPELALPKGNTIITYYGVGTVNIKYREAVL